MKMSAKIPIAIVLIILGFLYGFFYFDILDGFSFVTDFLSRYGVTGILELLILVIVIHALVVIPIMLFGVRHLGKSELNTFLIVFLGLPCMIAAIFKTINSGDNDGFFIWIPFFGITSLVTYLVSIPFKKHLPKKKDNN